MRQTIFLLLAAHFFFFNTYGQTPRLLLTQERINQVRAAINVPGSHHARVYEIIRERAAQEGLGQYGTYRSGNYPRSFKAIENALLYLIFITEDFPL